MSLKKPMSSLKSGVKELGSVQGMKHVLTNLGAGFAIGAIVDLIMSYIFINFVNPQFKDPTTGYVPAINGFALIPHHTQPDGTPCIYLDDFIELLVTIAMLFTKKLWVTVGFFLGWYVTSYMGLYYVLGLPEPEVTP